MPEETNKANFLIGFRIEHLDKLVKQIDKVLMTLRKADQAFQQMGLTQKKSDKSTEELTKEWDKLTKTQTKQAAKLKEVIKLEKGYQATKARTKQLVYNANRELKEGLVTQAQHQEKVNRATGQYTDLLGNAIVRVIKYRIAFYALRKVMDIVAEGTRAAIELESVLAGIRKVTPVGADISVYMERAFGLAKQYGADVIELTKAMKMWAQQGLTVNEVLEATQAQLLATMAADLDAAKAVDFLTAARKVFGIEIKESTRAIDMLVAVQAKHAVTTTDLANAVMRAGPALTVFGDRLEFLIGLETAIGAATRKLGRQIGVSLRTMIARIPREESIKIFEEINVAVMKNEYEFRNLRSILIDLAAAWDGLSEPQQVVMAQTVAGVRRVEDFHALLLNFNEALEAERDALFSVGDAERKARFETETLRRTFQRTTAATIEFFSAIWSPPARTIAKVILGIATSMGSLLKAMPPVVKQALFFSTILRLMMGLWSKINPAIESFTTGMVRTLRTEQMANRVYSKSVVILGHKLHTLDALTKANVKLSTSTSVLAAKLRVAGVAAVRFTGFTHKMSVAIAGAASAFVFFGKQLALLAAIAGAVILVQKLVDHFRETKREAKELADQMRLSSESIKKYTSLYSTGRMGPMERFIGTLKESGVEGKKATDILYQYFQELGKNKQMLILTASEQDLLNKVLEEGTKAFEDQTTAAAAMKFVMADLEAYIGVYAERFKVVYEAVMEDARRKFSKDLQRSLNELRTRVRTDIPKVLIGIDESAAFKGTIKTFERVPMTMERIEQAVNDITGGTVEWAKASAESKAIWADITQALADMGISIKDLSPKARELITKKQVEFMNAASEGVKEYLKTEFELMTLAEQLNEVFNYQKGIITGIGKETDKLLTRALSRIKYQDKLNRLLREHEYKLKEIATRYDVMAKAGVYFNRLKAEVSEYERTLMGIVGLQTRAKEEVIRMTAEYEALKLIEEDLVEEYAKGRKDEEKREKAIRGRIEGKKLELDIVVKFAELLGLNMEKADSEFAKILAKYIAGQEALRQQTLEMKTLQKIEQSMSRGLLAAQTTVVATQEKRADLMYEIEEIQHEIVGLTGQERAEREHELKILQEELASLNAIKNAIGAVIGTTLAQIGKMYQQQLAQAVARAGLIGILRSGMADMLINAFTIGSQTSFNQIYDAFAQGSTLAAQKISTAVQGKRTAEGFGFKSTPTDTTEVIKEGAEKGHQEGADYAKQALMDAFRAGAALLGTTIGVALGAYGGAGNAQSAAIGSNIGSALISSLSMAKFGAAWGPLGALGGGILGGLVGGLFGEPDRKRFDKLAAVTEDLVEEQERNTSALESNTNALRDLRTQIINAPSTFAMPPFAGVGGEMPVINVQVNGNSPDLENRVIDILNKAASATRRAYGGR